MRLFIFYSFKAMNIYTNCFIKLLYSSRNQCGFLICSDCYLFKKFCKDPNPNRPKSRTYMFII